MFKVVILINRKAGMSMEAFKAYYEATHAPLAKLMPFWTDYRRNYAVDGEDFGTGHLPQEAAANRPFDVMTEMMFENRVQYQKVLDALSMPDVGGRIAKDEENLFDRSSMRVYVVEEHISQPVINPAA